MAKEIKKEIKDMNKAELREHAETLCKEFNDCVQGGDFAKSVTINDEIVGTVNAYTAIARKECFEALAKKADPMLEAVKQLIFQSIRVKDTKQGEEKIPVRIIEDTDRYIDLLKLHNFIEGGIGADKQWMHYIEKLNLLLTAQKAKDLGIDPKEINDSFAMSELSKAIDMGKTPTSKTNMLKTLTTVVQAMIGEEYKPISHDVNFLMSVYSKKNRRALTVSCSSHKNLRQYIAEICHKIVMNETYKLDYRKAK